MPTVPTTAWPATGPDLAAAVRERTLRISYTSVFNDTGHPAISLPAGLSPDGLPCAVQLVAPHHREDLALGSAQTLEARPGHPAAAGFRHRRLSDRGKVADAGARPTRPSAPVSV